MGLTKVTVSLCDLRREGTPFEAEFLVDTGAIDCMAPEDKLDVAGIEPEGEALYELADGEPRNYRYGFARVSFMGSETVAQVIFAPKGTEPLLGVAALENVGIVVDPVTKTLKRLHAKPLK